MEALRSRVGSLLTLAMLGSVAWAWYQDLGEMKQLNVRLSRELMEGRSPAERLVTIKLSHWTTLGGFIRPGDRVDLILVKDGSAKVALQDIAVAAVSPPNDNHQVLATLELNKRQAEALADELPAMWASIRPAKDRNTVAEAVEKMNLDDVLRDSQVHRSMDKQPGGIDEQRRELSDILQQLEIDRNESKPMPIYLLPPWPDRPRPHDPRDSQMGVEW